MFEFLVAFRYLRSQRKVRAVFSTALISVFGISVGVFSLNTVLAVMSGFQTELQRTILGTSPHVLVSNYGGQLDNRELVKAEIERVPGVGEVSTVVYGTGLFVSKYSSHWTNITGVNPTIHKGAAPLSFPEENGGTVFPLLENKERAVLIGHSLAASLGVGKGDSVTFVSPRSGGKSVKDLRTGEFTVAGLFKYGIAPLDSGTSYVRLSDMEEFFEGSVPVAFEVTVGDPLKANLVANGIEDALGFPFVAQSWQKANDRLFNALRLEKLGLAIFLGFIVLVASLSVMSSLLMIMIEKSRDIAILYASGATGGQVSRIFVIMGSVLGFTGTVAGTVLSLVLCYLLADSETVAGLIPFDPVIYGISKFPVTIEPLYFFIVGVTSQLFCILSALYPAHCARPGNLAAKLKV